MREVSFNCDRCNNRYLRENIVCIDYTMSKYGSDRIRKPLDLCRQCYRDLEKFYTSYMQSISEGWVKPTEKEEPDGHTVDTPAEETPSPAPKKKRGSSTVDEPAPKRGKLSTMEQQELLKMCIDGTNYTVIASKLQRTESYIRSWIQSFVSGNGVITADNEAVKKILSVDPKQHGFSVVSSEDRDKIFELHLKGMDSKQIADELGRTQQGVSRIINAWVKEHGPVTKEGLEKYGNGFKTGNERLTVYNTEQKSSTGVQKANGTSSPSIDVAAVLALHEAGWSVSDIAKDVRCHPYLVKNIIAEAGKR